MVYVEPEVVNPPKKQSVPQFNKKEIIEVVKAAQEAGLLPSGGGSGTKLYSHTVTLQVMYESEMHNTTCKFITTSSESFTGKSNEVLNDGTYVSGVIDLAPLWGITEEGPLYNLICSIGSGSERMMLAFDQNNNPMEINYGSFGQDAVTEL